MKIIKFNENLEENIKDCSICIIFSESEIVNSCVFETEKDMDNWLLNLIR